MSRRLEGDTGKEGGVECRGGREVWIVLVRRSPAASKERRRLVATMNTEVRQHTHCKHNTQQESNIYHHNYHYHYYYCYHPCAITCGVEGAQAVGSHDEHGGLAAAQIVELCQHRCRELCIRVCDSVMCDDAW
jgi:predicted nucleic acid-binding protein